MKMKILDYKTLVMLNESSIRADRKQNLRAEQMPIDTHGQYIVNFRFDHAWKGRDDVRLSIILKPGAQTAWLDISPEEFATISEFEMSELDWEAAVCVGTPRWTD
jgi:hypothetical protein